MYRDVEASTANEHLRAIYAADPPAARRGAAPAVGSGQLPYEARRIRSTDDGFVTPRSARESGTIEIVVQVRLQLVQEVFASAIDQERLCRRAVQLRRRLAEPGIRQRRMDPG